MWKYLRRFSDNHTYVSWPGILEYFRRSYFDGVSRIPDSGFRIHQNNHFTMLLEQPCVYYACRVLSQPYKTGRQKLHLSEKTQLWNVLSCTFLELLSCRKWCNSSKRWEKSGKKSGPPPDEERLLLIGCTNWPSVLLYVFNTSRCHLWVSFLLT